MEKNTPIFWAHFSLHGFEDRWVVLTAKTANKPCLAQNLWSFSGKKVVLDMFLHVKSIAGEEKSVKPLEHSQNLYF